MLSKEIEHLIRVALHLAGRRDIGLTHVGGGSVSGRSSTRAVSATRGILHSSNGPYGAPEANILPGNPTAEFGQLFARLVRPAPVVPAGLVAAKASNSPTLASELLKLTGGSFGSGHSNFGGILSGILGSGFGLPSLVSGILGLFGGHKAAPPVLQKFVLPTAVRAEAGINRSNQFVGSAAAQGGLPRMETSNPSTSTALSGQTFGTNFFLDHSDDIAQAVREAMLHSHPLNDLVSDL